MRCEWFHYDQLNQCTLKKATASGNGIYFILFYLSNHEFEEERGEGEGERGQGVDYNILYFPHSPPLDETPPPPTQQPYVALPSFCLE